MTASALATPAARALRPLWRRQLASYPDLRPRRVNLMIVIGATIVLYYEFYIPGAVAPAIIAHYGMSFPYYVYVLVAGNAVGAFGALAAGLADRWGRANIVAYGLVVTGLLTGFALPNAPDQLSYAIEFAAVGIVEGMILVVTPALVRDFSPHLGESTAMGFSKLGPVIGSLAVCVVASSTLDQLRAWQDQFTICGAIGLATGLVAVAGLRELSPALRSQLVISVHNRVLAETRARGLDTGMLYRRPWRQMLHTDIIGPAFGVSVLLIIYYTAVGFLAVYFTTLHGFSLATANSLGNWFWAFDACTLLVFAVLSDRIGVRKPFMVAGTAGAIAMTIVFLNLGTRTSYATFALVITLIAVFLSIAFAPWMAAFTETVERRNPMLTATGLAVLGWTLRAIIAISMIVLPSVVSSMTPLVTYGPRVAELSAKYTTQAGTLQAIDPRLRAVLRTTRGNAAVQSSANAEIRRSFGVTMAQATRRLDALAAMPKTDLDFLVDHGPQVADAAAAAPGQWRTWWWICVGGEAAFLPLILLMAGRWNPRRAREEAAEHEREVQLELAALEQPSHVAQPEQHTAEQQRPDGPQSDDSEPLPRRQRKVP